MFFDGQDALKSELDRLDLSSIPWVGHKAGGLDHIRPNQCAL